MTIRQVLPDGTGTSGAGKTWNDLSDATSAYIGQAGFDAAVTASVAGDIVYVMGSDNTGVELRIDAATGTALTKDKIQIIGVKPGTVNNQFDIDTDDLIPGQRTGAADLDTGSISLAVGSTTTITRASGDFTADNFVVGQVINPKGFSTAGNNGEFRLSGVSAGTLTIDEALLTVEAAGAGRCVTAKVYAYDSPDIPTFTTTSQLVLYTTFEMYGVKIDVGTAITIHATSILVQTVFEECWLECGSNQSVSMGGNILSDGVILKNTRLVMPGTTGKFFPGLNGRKIKMIGGEFSKGGGAFIQGSSGSGVIAGGDFSGVRFHGGATDIVDYSYLRDEVSLNRCKFPTGYALVTGTPTYDCQVENYGSDSDSGGITTSEQNFEVEGLAGSLAIETTAVRTGGATDGAAGAFSIAMTSIAGNTSAGKFALKAKLRPVLIEGDGTAKTLTVRFASDTGNAKAIKWENDKAWVELENVSAAGGSRSEYKTTLANLLATPAAGVADAVSTWGAGAVRPQEISVTIAPDYTGFVIPTLCFAPDDAVNAETIYAEPKSTVA